MPSKRFICPDCGHQHALQEHPHVLRNVAPGGKLFCEACGNCWFVATVPSGVVPREGDEVCAWLNNWSLLVCPAEELISRLIADYIKHAAQRISLEEPAG
jgi:hypothetical protein